jgi:Tol biopolymer transport system component
MNSNRLFACLLCVLSVACSQTCSDDSECGSASSFPELKGPYLGQEPPGLEPEIFAPGIVSTGLATRDVAMMPDGNELYFAVTLGGRTMIMETHRENGIWTEPAVAPFSGRYLDIEPAISPDGQRFYFLSTRPQPGQEEKSGWVYQDIWVMDREGESWGEPSNLGPPVNSEAPEYFPSVANDGTLYFTREGEDRVSATWRSRFVDGAFAEPEKLGPEVNCGSNRFNVYVAPDESFAIVPSVGREDSLGGVDYYVVFRSEEDTWTEPVNMGPAINQPEGRQWSASLSPDGKFLFFMTSRAYGDTEIPLASKTVGDLLKLSTEPGWGNSSIWWVSAEVIEALRPE